MVLSALAKAVSTTIGGASSRARIRRNTSIPSQDTQEGSTIERAQERTETHCLAGHIRFELANPGPDQLIGFA